MATQLYITTVIETRSNTLDIILSIRGRVYLPLMLVPGLSL